jgi:hypothetical protein
MVYQSVALMREEVRIRWSVIPHHHELVIRQGGRADYVRDGSTMEIFLRQVRTPFSKVDLSSEEYILKSYT